jgi:hypothetical protein
MRRKSWRKGLKRANERVKARCVEPAKRLIALARKFPRHHLPNADEQMGLFEGSSRTFFWRRSHELAREAPSRETSYSAVFLLPCERRIQVVVAKPS